MFKHKHLEEESNGDFAFEVYADTLEELFKGAGFACMGAMVKIDALTTNINFDFSLKAPELPLLLYDFLSELVYLKDVEAVLFKDFEIKISKNTDFNLQCVAKGRLINWDTDELYTDVKAVTMHTMVVEQRENQWYCHVLLDL